MRMHPSYRCRLEALEPRLPLAGNVAASLSAQVLELRGDDAANDLLVSQDSAGVIVIQGRSGTTINGQASVRFPGEGLQKTDVRLFGGDDTLTIDTLRMSNDLSIEMGLGDDGVALNNTRSGFVTSVKTDDGADRITATGVTTGSDLGLLTGQGAGTVNVRGSNIGGSLIVIGLDGADNVDVTSVVVQKDVNVNTGKGSDTVVLVDVSSTLSATITTDLGDDRVRTERVVTGEDLKVHAGEGSDSVSLVDTRSRKNIEVNVDTGNDYVLVDEVFAAFDATFIGGDGSDTFENRGVSAGQDLEIKEFEQVISGGVGNPGPTVVSGADAGARPEVRAFDAATGALRSSFLAYADGFRGGVRVATGDVTGDGTPDVITSPGAGGGPHIKIFDGATGALVREFFAYAPNFTGGVHVAAGDVNADGRADIVTGAGAGGGPHVRVFSGLDGSVLRDFFAYAPSFTGGVHVAAGDVNADGRADIVTGAGAGGGPHVRVFSGLDRSLLRDFFAYAPSFTGGVYVAAGDVNADGRADIVTGAGAGGGPHVMVFSGTNLAVLRSFYAYAPSFTGGVRVGVVRDVNGDGRADLIVAAGPGGGPHAQVRSAASDTVFSSFLAYDLSFAGGVFVSGF